MRSRRSRLASAAFVALTLVVVGTGCSSGSKSASDQLCRARTDLSNTINKVADDVRSANLGAAKNGLKDVQAAYNNLVDAYNSMSAEERGKVQAQIQKIQTDVASLNSSTSAEEVGRTLDTVQSDVQSALTSIKDNLHCG